MPPPPSCRDAHTFHLRGDVPPPTGWHANMMVDLLAINPTIGVRIRPLSSKETKRGSNSCISTTEGKHVFVSDPDEKMNGRDYLRLDKNKDKAYQFDCAFGPEQTTEEVYNATVKRVIAAVMDGFHGSCFVRPPSSDLTFAPSLLHLQAPLSRSLRHGPSSAGVWCHR